MTYARTGTAALLCATAIIFAATGCGGSSAPDTGLWRLGESGAPSAPQDIFDIVPAGAAYVYAYDISGNDARLFATAAHADPSFTAINQYFIEATGRSLLASDDAQPIGFDPTGDVALFSTSISPIVIARLEDTGAFQSFLLDVQRRNPDIEWGKRRLGGADFLTADRNGFGVDTAVVGNHAVARVRLGDPSLDVDDAAFEAILLGAAGPGLRSDPRVQRMLEGNTRPLVAIAAANTRTVWEILAAADARSETSLLGDYESSEQRQRCQRASEQLFAAIPWFGTVGVHETDLRQRYTYRVSLSPSAAATARTLLPGTFTDVLSDAGDPAFFLAGNFDFQKAIRMSNADASLASCPDAGAIVGWVGKIRELVSERANRLPVDGLAALGLYDIDLDALIPSLDAVLAIGSRDAIAVAELVQSILEESGATGSVDETAPHITLDYSLFGLRVRLIQTEDRVVLATGAAPTRIANALSDTTARVPGEPFQVFAIDGAQLASMFDKGLRWLEETGLASTDTRSLAAAADMYRNIVSVVGFSHVDEAGLTIDVTTELAPTVETQAQAP